MPERDLPRGIVLGLATLVACSFLTLVLSAGIPPGAAALARSSEPLFDGLRAIFGEKLGSALSLVAVAGLVASFHTIVFAYGRQIFSLSRAGYFPRWLSVTHGRRQTPHHALWLGAAIGYAVALAVWLARPEASCRRGAPEPRGVRRRDLLRAADGLVRAAADPPARDRAPLSQPARHPGRRGRAGDLARDARGAVRERPDLSAASRSRRCSGSRWAWPTSRSGAATAS